MSPERFVADRARQTHGRDPRPWERHAYHVLALRRRIEALSRELPLGPGGRLLDLGCANLPYAYLFPPPVEHVGADLPGNPRAALTITPDGRVPAPDASFDAVLSTQVLEHVADPRVYLGEARRLLRPGGRLLLTTHGTFAYHPDPVDLWRWTGAGLGKAVSDAGFEVVRFEGIVGLMPSGLQLVQDALLEKVSARPARLLVALVMQTLVRIADRLHSPESRARDAQVFALVAERP